MEILPYRAQLLLYLVKTRRDFQGAGIVKAIYCLDHPSRLCCCLSPMATSLVWGKVSLLSPGIQVIGPKPIRTFP